MLYSYPILIKRFSPDSGEAGMFEGLASTPGRDRHGDIIEPGAFAESVEALNSGKRRIPLLYNHNAAEQIGGIKTAAETPEGLFVTGQIVPGTPAADRIHTLAKASSIALSVGFYSVEAKPEGNGQRFKRVDLAEISAVPVPSNRESRILSMKNLDQASPDQFERLFRDLEVPGRLAKKLTRACLEVYEAEDAPDHDPRQLAALKAAIAGTLQTFKSR